MPSVTGNPLKIQGLDERLSEPAPAVGSHTDQVLQDLLGYDQRFLAELRRDGVAA